jgi:hypothetical protein
MEFKLFKELIRQDSSQSGLYNLIEPHISYLEDVSLTTYEVKRGEDMRLDLIFNSMYNLEPTSAHFYNQNMDVILNINNIDNPLNIVEGMILIHPTNLNDLEFYRTAEDEFKTKNKNINKRLAVPNVSRKVDPNRKKFTDNGYSFPPTVQKNPKDPVTIQNGRFVIGGV